jgi:hypothetical protein
MPSVIPIMPDRVYNEKNSIRATIGLKWVFSLRFISERYRVIDIASF